MRTSCAVLLSVLLSLLNATPAWAASATTEEKLVISGRLTRISAPPHCGMFFFGAVAEYSDLRVIRGKYAGRRIFVVHGCPELTRPELSPGAGSLRSFEIGARHRLELTTTNLLGIELVIDDGIGVRKQRYFASRVDPAPEK